MTMEQLRKAYREQPFRAFALRLADGREIRVDHPEFLAIPPDPARTFMVTGPGEDHRIIDLLLVVSLDFIDRQVRQKRGKHNGRNG
jgi:hypothetical protein